MELRQIEYILSIYEEKNITRAAEKLFITQSALNQQLLKLERTLGTQLFYRTRAEVVPTLAGEVYIEYARKIMALRDEAYNKINDIAENHRGHLSIGFTPGRGIAIFSAVFPKFHSKYPNIQIQPMEHSVRAQQEMIAKGRLDIGFVTFGKGYKMNCDYKHIKDEEIMLAVPKNHPLATIPNNSEVDLARFKEDSFVLMYRNSTMRELVDNIFKDAGFKPKELFVTANSNTIVTMIRGGICCGVLPYYYIENNLDSMNCYYLPNHPSWSIGVIYRQGGYLSKAAKDFMEMAGEYLNK